MPDKLDPIDLGKEKTPGKAREKFYEQVKKLKAAGRISADVKLSSDDFFSILEKELNLETRQEKTGGKKFWLFGARKKEDSVYLSYGGEDIGYFNIDEADELGAFLASFNDAKNELSKAELNAFLQRELEGSLTQDEMAELQESVMSGIKSKGEIKDERRKINKDEKKIEQSNDANERKLVSQAQRLAKYTKTLLLEFQDTTMTMHQQVIKDGLDKLGKLSAELISKTVGSAEREERYKIQSEIILTVCEIKYFLDKFKVSGNIFQKKTVDFDKEIEKILQGMGVDKGGYRIGGKNIWKNKRIKRTLKYIKALETVNSVGVSARKRKKARKIIDEFEANYPEVNYAGKMPTAYTSASSSTSGKSSRGSGSGRSGKPGGGRASSKSTGRGGTGSTASATPKSGPHVKAGMTTYSNPDDLGATGGRKINKVETDGIEIKVDRNGNPYAKVDRTNLTPRNLVEGYNAEKKKATDSGASRRAKNGLWNYSFAILDQVFEHPEDKDTLFAMLGGAEGVTGGKIEFREIMKRIFFDTKFQKGIKAEFWKLKQDLYHNKFPPEWDMFRPDAKAKQEDMLLEIAFTRQLPERFSYYRGLFERNTKGDHSDGLPTASKVKNFVNSMGVHDIAGFVRDGVDASIDLDGDLSRTEALAGHGVTKQGGWLDANRYKWDDAIDKSDMIPEGLKGFVKGGNKFVHKAGKFIYKGGGLVMLGMAGRNAIRGVGAGIGALFTAPPAGTNRFQNAVGALFNGVFGERAAGSNNPLNRSYFGGALAPFMTWLGLKTVDKTAGTQTLYDGVAQIFDEDAKARVNADKNINAVTLDYETHSARKGIEKTVGTMTMQDIQDGGLIFADGAGKTYVDLSKLSDDELKDYIPAYNARGDQGEIGQLRDSMGKILRDEYHLGSELLTDLIAKYPNTTLNELLKRYEEHALRPSMGVRGVLPQSIYSDEEYNAMNYLPEADFKEKAEDIAFLGQQWNKLNDPNLMDDFVNTGAATLPKGIDAVTYLSTMKNSTDANGVTLNTWVQNHMKKIAQLPVGTDPKSLIETYFRALYSAAGNRTLLVTSGGSNLPVWSYSPGTKPIPEQFGLFFHDASIGNGAPGSEYQKNPTLGGAGITLGKIVLNRDIIGAGKGRDDV